MAETKAWVEVSLECSGELAEAVAEIFARYAPEGVVINSVTRFDEQEQEQIPTGMMRVVAYLPEDEQLETNRRSLEEALWHMSQIVPLPGLDSHLIPDQDWMAAWKEHYQPLKIGRQWLIMPAWLTADPEEKRLIIRIDPSMAFGTGTHPSTQLCLQAIEDHLQPDQAVIDLGCGSGILAIAALKAGAGCVLAVDTDEQAVIATQNNALINAIHANLEPAQGSLEEILQGKYAIKQAPLVLANILAPVLIRLFHEGLAGIVAPGGKLVLAGILEHQAEDVLAAARAAGLQLITRYQKEDWVALVVG
ncbi:MAG: 50S ribosomal protein L11 methyltransferase [Anaerolineaceae bacterium]